MRYIEAPTSLSNVYTGGLRSIFLAGGITSCPDWQQEMRGLLGDTNLVLLNPRRAEFPIHDPNAAEQQITWEHSHLRLADAVLFWFPCETLCPIVLYELGAWSMADKVIFVGVHPDYARRRDVEIQTELTKPWVTIVYSLQELAEQVKKWAAR